MIHALARGFGYETAETIWDKQVAPLLAEARRSGQEQGWDERAEAHKASLWSCDLVPDNPYRSPQPSLCHDGHHHPMCAKLLRNAECDQGGAA